MVKKLQDAINGRSGTLRQADSSMIQPAEERLYCEVYLWRARKDKRGKEERSKLNEADVDRELKTYRL